LNDVASNGVLRRVVAKNTLVSVILPTKDRGNTISQAIMSVLQQTWRNWELIIIDDNSSDNTLELVAKEFVDPRINIFRSDGTGVSDARNSGLRRAQADWIAYIDSDNTWNNNHLLFSLLAAEYSGSRSVYSALKRYRNGLKSETDTNVLLQEFSYDDLLVANYVDLNVFVHRHDLYVEYGGFDVQLKRMVDWDLILRYCKNYSPAVCPLIGAHYDWSPCGDRISLMESSNYTNLIRNKHWVDWDSIDSEPRDKELISIVICVFNNPEVTHNCLKSLVSTEACARFEIILVDNGSDAETAELLGRYERNYSHVTVVRNEENLNFALGSNLGFAKSRGELVVFLNNDTELTPGWLGALVKPLKDPEIVAVQPKLLYPDGTIQCIGLVFSKESPFAYPIFVGKNGSYPPTNQLHAYSAITAACMGIRAKDFAKVRGFDPIYINGQEDVDLCLKLGRGKECFAVVPDSVVVHHESKTDGRSKFKFHNRKVFSDRWNSKIVANDLQKYAMHQTDIPSFEWSDTDETDPELRIWRPQ
jgi:glycosyltransferase involved in cell wall biosynthesis